MCPNDDMISTGHSEDDDPFLERKRRRRKVKESQLVTSEESLLRRLDGLVVREYERMPCRVSEEWMKKI